MPLHPLVTPSTGPGREAAREGAVGEGTEAGSPEEQSSTCESGHVRPHTSVLLMANPNPQGTQASCEAAAGSNSWGTALGTWVGWLEARGNGFGPGGQGLKPSSATSWLGVLGQFAQLSCASVSSSVKKLFNSLGVPLALGT